MSRVVSRVVISSRLIVVMVFCFLFLWGVLVGLVRMLLVLVVD